MRLDRALVEQGLVRSRTRAQALVAEGKVLVDRAPATRPSLVVRPHQRIELAGDDPWVSRAAHKLLGALDDLGWQQVPARVLDAGASTGGFTQVLLSRGARTVYAVDVGHGQLADPVRSDARVRVHEGLNLRDLDLSHVDAAPVDLVVADISFISLTLLLDNLFGVLSPGGRALLMVKPQFEVGRERLGSGGVVRDDALRRAAVDAVISAAAERGWQVFWQAPSVLPGPAGNVEYFVGFERTGSLEDVGPGK